MILDRYCRDYRDGLTSRGMYSRVQSVAYRGRTYKLLFPLHLIRVLLMISAGNQTTSERRNYRGSRLPHAHQTGSLFDSGRQAEAGLRTHRMRQI